MRPSPASSLRSCQRRTRLWPLSSLRLFPKLSACWRKLSGWLRSSPAPARDNLLAASNRLTTKGRRSGMYEMWHPELRRVLGAIDTKLDALNEKMEKHMSQSQSDVDSATAFDVGLRLRHVLLHLLVERIELGV